MVNPHCVTAHRTRDTASFTEVSGIPTMCTPGRPPEKLTSTLTGTASAPRTTAERTVKAGISVLPQVCVDQMVELCVTIGHQRYGYHVKAYRVEPRSLAQVRKGDEPIP